MASTIMMMPNPPSHCDMLRQRRIQEGSDSTSANTVAPVAVSPDTDSKRASAKDVRMLECVKVWVVRCVIK